MEGLRYRMLWTWDHSTNWDVTQPGQQEEGCMNPYLKPPTAFGRDYGKLVDFMARQGLNGLIIWGLLRDAHGGVRAAQRLCHHAAKKGVRVLAGIGVMAYGGVYYQGHNPYSMENWLERHPEMSALDEGGRPYATQPHPGGPRMQALCPSREENVEWYLEGLEWLVENLEIGGINYESGDYGVCHCPECRCKGSGIDILQPGSRTSGITVSFDAMGDVYPVLMERVHEIDPDLWQVYSSYCGYRTDLDDMLKRFIEPIPDYAICQWTLTHMLAGTEGFDWPRDLHFPAAHNVGYLHQGSQWCDTSCGGRRQGRYDSIVETLQRAADLGAGSGLEGLAIHGEVSAEHPICGTNYRVFAQLCRNPTASLDGLKPELRDGEGI